MRAAGPPQGSRPPPGEASRSDARGDHTRATLLSSRDLAVTAGGRLLFEHLDFAVGPGECWAIVGPNGAGKTSLLHVLAGLAPPAAGSVAYGDTDVRALSSRERARLRSLLPQDSHDAFPATVLETALIGRHPHVARFAWESAADVALARNALALFGVAALEDRDVRTLSGGERRRVALATLVVQDAPIALLDEPSSHLDVGQQAAALEVFVRAAQAQQRALVMVLHDLHLATRFCDHAIAIGGGRARAGPAGELLSVSNLSELFGRRLVELAGEGLRTFVPRL